MGADHWSEAEAGTTFIGTNNPHHALQPGAGWAQQLYSRFGDNLLGIRVGAVLRKVLHFF